MDPCFFRWCCFYYMMYDRDITVFFFFSSYHDIFLLKHQYHDDVFLLYAIYNHLNPREHHTLFHSPQVKEYQPLL